jgi:hypothetical protein
VSFGLDGRNYEIDLTNENAEELRQALGKYVEAGRKGWRHAQASPWFQSGCGCGPQRRARLGCCQRGTRSATADVSQL